MTNWNDAALPAGTNLIGNVGIDQTTPGTTNAVQVKIISPTSDVLSMGMFRGSADDQANSNTLGQSLGLVVLNAGNTFDRVRSIAASGAGLGVLQVGTLGELITLAASAARTASANGTAVTGLGWRNRYIVLFDLTVADTDAGDTLDVYIDVSLDGSTWLNAVHFTQIIGTDAASKRYAVLDPSAPGTAEILVTADAAAGVVRPSLFGPQMRARWAIVDAGTDDASFTFSVVAYCI